MKRNVILLSLIMAFLSIISCTYILNDGVSVATDKGVPFVEAYRPDTGDRSPNFIGGTTCSGNPGTCTYNTGNGQIVIRPVAYKPTSFSFYIHTSLKFWDGTAWVNQPGATYTLQLKIWKKTAPGTLYGSSSVTISTGQTGFVTFTINNGTLIPENTEVLYAIYLPDAAANKIQGQVEMSDDDLYKPATNNEMYRTANKTDLQVDDYSQWSTLTSRDMTFELNGKIY